MGSDRARVSYDQSRQYRAVVAQQGRVTTEADTNEAWTINGEQTREEILDIVGPAGTPDDGYQVISPGAPTTPPFEFTVGPGTMYVGGLRSFLPVAVSYSAQDEWLDRIGDPDWVPPKVPADPQKARELVYLSLAEQEVSATEDRALLEVALGGPDTSQRTRLVQRIKRLGTNARTCEDALADANAAWAAQGLGFDPATMRLDSNARLLVSFTSTGTPPDPCDPQDQGGYLGADNQLIRVRVTTWNPDTNKGCLVWGFDDASFQYRVDVVNDSLVQLQARPPDELHEPRSGQAVELLRSTVRLDDADAFIASATGIVITLTDAYRHDTRRITLPFALPPSYTDATKTPVIFLRVWEQELEFTPGTPVTLGLPDRPTGMQVTLTSEGNPFHPGDFWLVAVRPATPTQVYPARYLVAPQPPDGPRLWACPLAVVGWPQGVMQIVADCRNPFDNLVEFTARRQGSGCCDVLVRPEDLNHTSLQAIVDRFAGKGQATICLTPGLYALPEPLRLGPKHSHLTIEACLDGAVIAAAGGAQDLFFDGLMVLGQADNVTLRGLQFDLPQVPFITGVPKLAATPLKMLAASTQPLNVSIGVHPFQCTALTVEDCLFRFVLDADKPHFGAGIFAQSECIGHQIRRNQFIGDDANKTPSFVPKRSRALFGYLLSPSLILHSNGKSFASAVSVLLQDGSFQDNVFSGLLAAVMVFARTGTVEIESNIVRNCFNGFIFAPETQPELLNLLNLAPFPTLTPIATKIADLLTMMMLNPAVQIGGVLARIYPLPHGTTPSNAVPIELGSSAWNDEDIVAMLTELARTMAPPAPMAANTEPETGGETAAERKTRLVRQATAEAAQLGFSKRVFSRFLDAQTTFAELRWTTASAPPERPTRLSLHLSDDDVQTIVGNVPSFGLAVYGHLFSFNESIPFSANYSAPSDLTMVGCRFLGQREPAEGSALALVTIISVRHCAISGNLVLNEQDGGNSLAVLPNGPGSESIAVVGNVFKGQTLLPKRPYDPTTPLGTWDTWNAIVTEPF